jgi:hypothetical protein
VLSSRSVPRKLIVLCRIAAATIVFTLILASAGCPARKPAPAPLPPPPSNPAVVTDSTQFTTGTFEGCPAEGSGGDPELNRLKNRDLPPPAYEPVTVEAILADVPAHAEETAHGGRSGWSDAARNEIGRSENRGVIVEGFLLKVKQMGTESCNCKFADKRDYHLWLAATPDADRARSIVVEVSPRLLPQHPNWRIRILSRLAKDRAKVRISGWMMFDQEHPDQVGKTRGTQWEIHPIHNIEVWSGGRWRGLDVP